MNVDIIELYQSILESQGIQHMIFDENFHDIPRIDYELRHKLYKKYDYAEIINGIQRNSQGDSILFLRDPMRLDYCIFPLPPAYLEKYKGKYVVLGPVLFDVIDKEDIRKIMAEQQIPAHLFQNMLEFYNRVPRVPSYDFWFSLLRPLLVHLFDDSFSYKHIEMEHEPNPLFDQFKPSTDISLKMLEDRYYVENQLLQAVAEGNNEKALECHRRFCQFKMEPRCASSVRNLKNGLITLNTLLRKAIERSNIHPFYLDNISREFAVKIELCTTMKQLEHFGPTMIRKYCLLVNNHSGRNYSSIIEKCTQYIDVHYKEPISLDILSEYCHATPAYLSSRFKKETNTSITEYINNIRIEHSLLLLNTTRLSIQEISQKCGYADPNYYTKMFKKLKEITPLAYRKSVQG